MSVVEGKCNDAFVWNWHDIFSNQVQRPLKCVSYFMLTKIIDQNTYKLTNTDTQLMHHITNI